MVDHARPALAIAAGGDDDAIEGTVIDAADDADPMPSEPLTELGYARRFVRVYGDRLLYVPQWNRWLRWDGTRWEHDLTGQAHRWMKVIARRVTAAALAITDKEARALAVRAAKRGESSSAIRGAMSLAGTELGIVASPDDLDADPFLLNCANGTLDLRTGELRRHDPDDRLSKITGAAYDPAARGVEFSKFLERVQPDPAMRDYLARLLGHALEGRVVTHLLPIFSGTGANGKSTLTAAAMNSLGDYANAADPELLTARTFDAHPTGTADLCGMRLAVLHETDRGRRLAEATVKRLTGGDRIKARRMREDFWSFEPSHTFLMLTNHKPIIGGTDEGIWRRIRLVPWEVVIPPAEQDEALADKLALEADAILAWLVKGYAEWRENGLAEPEQVTAATDAYRGESDALGRFLAQRCMEHGSVGSTELFRAWQAWCAEEGEEPGTQTTFSTNVQNKGFNTYASYGRKRFRGLGLAAVGENDVEGCEGSQHDASRARGVNQHTLSTLYVPPDER